MPAELTLPTLDQPTILAMTAGVRDALGRGDLFTDQAADALLVLSALSAEATAANQRAATAEPEIFTGVTDTGLHLLLSIYPSGHREIATRTDQWGRWSPPITLTNPHPTRAALPEGSETPC